MIKNSNDSFKEIHTYLSRESFRCSTFDAFKIFTCDEKKVEFKFNRNEEVIEVTFVKYNFGVWTTIEKLYNPSVSSFYVTFSTIFKERSLKEFESFYDNID